MVQETPKRWIWEHENYGTFPYDMDELVAILNDIHVLKRMLDNILSIYGESVVDEVQIENVTEEIYDNSRIEGEQLERESIRNSMAKAIDKNYAQSHGISTKHTDALVDLFMESRENNKPITVSRLHNWHRGVFIHTRTNAKRSEEDKIVFGHFRDKEVRVVEELFGHRGKRTRYLAPPSETLEEDVQRFLDYCNNSHEDPYIKAAIAHLWFVSIHPYDDGNGRISRAVADHILAHETKEQYKTYSVSSGIYMKHADYYGILSETTDLYRNRHFDFTPWIKWHLEITLAALKKSLKESTFIIERGKFWENHQDIKLNDRESKTINAMFDALSKGKIKSFTTKEYMAEHGVSRSTARRDINALVAYNMLAEIIYEGEHCTRYILKTDETSDLDIFRPANHEENTLHTRQSKPSRR
jgi:Fic family protein